MSTSLMIYCTVCITVVAFLMGCCRLCYTGDEMVEQSEKQIILA